MKPKAQFKMPSKYLEQVDEPEALPPRKMRTAVLLEPQTVDELLFEWEPPNSVAPRIVYKCWKCMVEFTERSHGYNHKRCTTCDRALQIKFPDRGQDED